MGLDHSMSCPRERIAQVKADRLRTEDEMMTKLELAVQNSTELRPRTKDLYLRHVRAFLAFAGTDPKNWTHTAVTAWRDDMRKRRVKRQSINVALVALRFAARHIKQANDSFAAHTEALPVRKPRRTKKARGARAIDHDEAKRLIEACKGDRPRDLRDMAIVVLGLRTGMLRFSMCQIQLDDLRGDQMTFVKRGGERHTLKMDSQIQEALAPWLIWLKRSGVQGGSLFRSLGRKRSDGKFDIGKSLTPDGLYRALQQRAKRADIADFNPHVFRKTFLAWVTEKGAQPHQIAMVTGHKSDGTPEGSKDPPANTLIPNFISITGE